MTKKRSTKSALLLSVLSLLMCVSMLVGSTFAWFTDSVTSANNIIKSGTLDIEMYYADGTQALDSVTWEDASKKAIFNYDKWEPGYVEVKHIKISNVGNLALKYQLNIAANGAVSELADVIDVYYADPAVQVPNRAALEGKTSIGTLTDILGGMPSNTYGELEAGKDAIVTIALKMKETAGNTYQTLSIGSDFSVELLATQLDYEEDSFGPEYDEGLTPPDADGDIVKNIDGVIYVYSKDGTARLYSVTPEFTGDTVVVLDGIDTIGAWAFYQNPGVKNVIFSDSIRTISSQAFKDSKVESVVLNEGITEIGYQAFNNAKELKSFNIPSTVKTIAEKAFAVTAATEVTIPAGVESIEKCFRDMPNLTTVTVEGNTYIGEFSFRNCPSLRTVYLKGDDVKIHNNIAFCNASTNNPNVNNITFYVENEIVASRVKTAMGSGNDFYIYINDQEVKVVDAANQAELQAALDSAVDGTIINITNDITGDVTVTQKQNTKIIINGNNKTFKGAISIDGKSATILTAGLTIKNVNFDATAITTDACINMGIKGNNNTRYVTNLTVENCTFTGNYPTAEQVGIKTYTGGGQNLTVKGCTATNMHSLAQLNNIINVTFEGCKVVGSKNGISVGASRNAKITNCEFSVASYGIRGDAIEVDSALTITDCKIDGAYIPVVIRKASSAQNSFALTLNGTNTITGIKNTDGLWCAVGVEEYGDVTKDNLTVASANVTVTINDSGLSASGVYGTN